MAEGVLAGVLGDEEEKPEIQGPAAPDGPQAFAAAVAARLSANDPGVARKTEAFLDRQAKLVEVQTEHLKGEYAARLHLLQGQAREVDLRRFGLRLRVGFQLFLALAATAIGIGFVMMVHDAITSHRVVIEPFDAPPSLAERGVTGKVLSTGLLDELTRLQEVTRSSATARDISGAWSDNIKLDVPDTGISIAEISRLLKERFGHDLHIGGDLTESESGGVALTVRGNGVLAKTFTGSPAELHKLIVAAAEYIYSRSQPARWGSYLTLNGRNAEVIEFCRSMIAGADPMTRAHLLNDWANALENTGGSLTEALNLSRAAIREQPDLWRSYSNLMNTLWLLGREEEAWRAGEAMRAAAGGRPGRAPELYYTNSDTLTWNLQAALQASETDAAANSAGGTQVADSTLSSADFLMRMHDPAGADLQLKTTREDPRDLTIGAITHFVRGRLAAEAGDTATALSELEAFGKAYEDPTVYSNYPGYACWIAPAEEAAGHPDRADAILAATGSFVDCYRFHADILDGRGDWAAAQSAYARAVALAPDLPGAYYSWGVALARHGDFEAAVSKLRQAHDRGPHWADPLKAWADVLLKQGRAHEALGKYDEALRYAPNWAALREAREAAKQRS